MKKILFIILLAALFYPYAKEYYLEHFADDGLPADESLSKFVSQFNKDLPKTQGLLTYDSAVEATGSMIILIKDAFPSLSERDALTKAEAQDRINTWRPFLIDQTCRDKRLSKALERGLLRGIYYQFSKQGLLVDYGKILITPSMC